MATRHRLSIALLASLSAFAAHAATSAPAAPPQGLSWEWNARARYEAVDDALFARDAEAATVRVRAGLHWRHVSGLETYIEGEGVADLAGDFDSTANRRAGFPVIADPTGAELNQAWLRWQRASGSLTAGRQRIALDNQRWVGNVGWRQNEQTFDAIAAQWNAAPGVTLRYAFLDRVHRVNGDRAVDPRARERDLSTQLLNLAIVRGAQSVVGYAYLHDDGDVPSASTRTLGLRYAMAAAKGTRPWGLVAEVARQSDDAGNPLDFSHPYLLVEPSLLAGPVALRAGFERLGGDGRHALQTPLATLHAFNGWADRFTATPAFGLEDRYVAATGSIASLRVRAPVEWTLAWHDFRADTGSARYGRELDASLAMAFTPAWRGIVKWADYRADAYSRDANKLWLQVEWSGAGTPR